MGFLECQVLGKENNRNPSRGNSLLGIIVRSVLCKMASQHLGSLHPRDQTRAMF